MLDQVTTGQESPVDGPVLASHHSPEPPSGDGGPPPPVSPMAPIRLAAYAAVLIALCFIQAPKTMVADTKFDLLTDPWHFLARGLHLWDAQASFGQIPDQAYGYAWPMGPFFGLWHLLGLPPWAIQRLWWALLLCVAFFGILKLATQLRLGSELTRVVAALCFVLTPRMTTLVGTVSVEIWPMALAPWVLVPLVRGAERGSPRRAAALSALVVACCGGVNAVAVAAVLPLGLIWLLTRTPGRRRRLLLCWWIPLTVLATLWWSGPLLLMGRYAPPFLDYIENAAITTLPTDATRTLLGVSDWVAYFGGDHFSAGLHIIGTPYLLLDAAVIAALGLIGLSLRSNEHRRFLVLGLLAGLVLVGLGYSRDLAGFFADARNGSLDQALAPLRNLHKFDVVLRIPLVLGLAHALAVLPDLLRGRAGPLARRSLRATVALAVVALLTPWLYTVIAAPSGVSEVPRYWKQAANYLAHHDDGSVALELPATSFGVYNWGNVHDDVLQGLARSPWAVRSVVPLAQPGNVVFLDAVTRAVESGRPSPMLASYLAANGVGRLVVRNDLDRLKTGAPDPAYVASVLQSVPGITHEVSFGPLMGSPAYVYAPDAKQTRLVAGTGISRSMRAIDVYRVEPPVRGALSDPGRVLVGDPSSALDQGMATTDPSPRLLAEDRRGTVTSQILTDGMKRRETNFPAVRWNESSTMTPGAPFRLAGKEGTHRIVRDEARWTTTAQWDGGIRGVTARSSQAYADATPPLETGSHPGAVFDGDPATAWRSARDSDPNGQWWQVRFDSPRTIGVVTVRLAGDSVNLRSLRISGGGQARVVKAPAPGKTAAYVVGLPTTRALRISSVYDGPLLTGSVAISEVGIDDLRPQRYLRLPAPLPTAPTDRVSLTRDPDRLPCAVVGDAFACDPILRTQGEDGDTLAREFQVSTPDTYTIRATASLRRNDDVWNALLKSAGVRVSERGAADGDPATAAGAMVDGDPSTTWIASEARPRIALKLSRPIRLRNIDLAVNPGAAASQAERIEVFAGKRHAVVDLDSNGHGQLPHWRVQHLELRIDSTRAAFSDEGSRYRELEPGVSELELNGHSLTHGVFSDYRARCGQGPKVLVDGAVYDTSFTGNIRDLVRGASLPLELCGADRADLDGASRVLSAPTRALRVDAVTLTRVGAAFSAPVSVDAARDGRDVPQSVQIPQRDTRQVLSLPQNLNAGWQATLDGDQLEPVRVDGWKQGWLVPAGAAGTVVLSFAPSAWFGFALAAGVLGLLLVLAAVSPLRLRRGSQEEPDALATGPSGPLDAMLGLVAVGLLMGWYAVAVVTAVSWAVLRWRWAERAIASSVPAAIALLLAAVGMTWGPLKERSWAMYWSQGFAGLAIVLVLVGLVRAGWWRDRGIARRTRPGRHGSPPAPGASATAGS